MNIITSPEFNQKTEKFFLQIMLFSIPQEI